MANLDLNLLRVLKVLLDVRNTHKAAELLHVSQSSVSKSLAKLRHYFNDPLFVRDQYGLTPTLRAIELGKQLPLALERLDQVIDNNRRFAPGQIDSMITIAMNSFIFHWLGKRLFQTIVEQAPNAELHLVHWHNESEAQMLKGGIDVGINYLSPYISKQIHQQRLSDDEFVCVVGTDHPYQQASVSTATFNHYAIASLMIPSWNYQQAKMLEAVKKHNANLKVQFRSTSLTTILEILEHTDLILPCPRQFAQNLDPARYRILEITEELPQINGTVVLAADKVHREDPLIRWLSQQVQQIASTTYRGQHG